MILFGLEALVGAAALAMEDQAKPIPGLPAQAKYDFQGEVTFIGQGLPSFPSRYSGPNSLPSHGQIEATETATVYAGARVIPNLEVYINPEISWGSAAGTGSGLAGYQDGDYLANASYNASPYFARAFVRWRLPLRQGKDQAARKELVGRSLNVIAGPVPLHRLIVTVGKFAATDIFDFNSYANNARNQFINNAFMNNLAYDYAEDARGYDYGASLAFVHPTYAVRMATFAMPTMPGATQLEYSFSESHSEQIELELDPHVLRTPKPPLTIRFLGFRNVGNMGTYEDALTSAGSGQVPSLSGVRSYGTVRSGFGINAEQGLADGGNTGLFARMGWADGWVETDAYAEADQAASFGAQISGAKWKRGADLVGIAFGWSGISARHQDLLAAGGQGFNLGDGGLNYGLESVAEAYYLFQVSKPLQITGDVQYITNPGYNRDRGPVPVFSVRAHYAF